jgi:hypothetical protein
MAKQSGPKGLFSALGGMGGGYLGGPVGSALGAKAGDLLAKITGFGAYQVSNNTLVNGNSVPSFRLSTDGVEISHREYIQDVLGTISFANSGLQGLFPINPGQRSTFPWLSTLAQNFEEYEMLGLIFEYRPSSGSAVSAASAALGVVIYATDYNVLAPAFTNKQQMESYEFSCSTVPFEGMLHPVECKKQSNALDTLYVRSGAVPMGADQRMYDLGLFQVATVGMQSAYTVGELWVSYHVRLKRPRINPTKTLGDFSHISESANLSATAAAPLGTGGGVIRSSSTLAGVVIVSDSVFQISNPGKYYFSSTFHTLSTDIGAFPTFTLGANIIASSVGGDLGFVDDSVVLVGALDSSASIVLYNIILTVTAAGVGSDNRVTIGGLTGMTTASADLWLFPLPDTVN